MVDIPAASFPVTGIPQGHYERRGASVYGEDKGPGTAPCIAACATVADADELVRHLNALLQRNRFAQGTTP